MAKCAPLILARGALVLHRPAVSINAYGCPGPEAVERDIRAVDHRYFTDDSPGGDNGFSLGVHDGCGCVAVTAQGIENIGADGRSLAVGKREHGTGYRSALERVSFLHNGARFGIDTGEERYRVRTHKQPARPPAPGNAATGNYQNHTT